MIMPENTTRKVDKEGRITIPASIRARFGLNIGDDMEYFVIAENDEMYIAFKKKVKEQ